MRSLSISPIVLALLTASSCIDSDSSPDVADTAVNDGEAIGEAHAGDLASELANDPADIRLAKSGAIMIAIDQAEIDQACRALVDAVDIDVRRFAAEMLSVHAAHIVVTEQMLASFDLEPLPNVISDDLELEASSSLDDLSQSTDFDSDYMLLQVQERAEAFVIVSELADLQDNAVDVQFFGDAAFTIADHREHASVILRGL